VVSCTLHFKKRQNKIYVMWGVVRTRKMKILLVGKLIERPPLDLAETMRLLVAW
jgi:hypothetical protein